MFGSYLTQSVCITLDYDPAADDVIPLWRAPVACELTGAYATVANDISGDTANYFELTLHNGGSAGTATTEIAGTAGGTGAWTGLTPQTMTISDGTLAAGDVVALDYAETGTGTFTQLVVQLDYVLGTGAN